MIVWPLVLLIYKQKITVKFWPDKIIFHVWDGKTNWNIILFSCFLPFGRYPCHPEQPHVNSKVIRLFVSLSVLLAQLCTSKCPKEHQNYDINHFLKYTGNFEKNTFLIIIEFVCWVLNVSVLGFNSAEILETILHSPRFHFNSLGLLHPLGIHDVCS